MFRKTAVFGHCGLISDFGALRALQLASYKGHASGHSHTTLDHAVANRQ